MNNKIYVIAGNFREFIDYLKNEQISLINNQYQYIAEPINLYGLKKPEIILSGTYYKREDWNELKLLLNRIEANIIYHGEHNYIGHA